MSPRPPSVDARRGAHRPDGVSRRARRTRRRAASARRSSSRSRRSSRPTRRRSSPISGLRESGLDRVIRASYDLLGYMSFFTVGEDECRAWSIPRGTQRAGRGRRDPQRHRARLHPRRSGRLRRAHRARLDGGVPRARRGAARRQGVRRAGRRHHQLPPRHLSGRRCHMRIARSQPSDAWPFSPPLSAKRRCRSCTAAPSCTSSSWSASCARAASRPIASRCRSSGIRRTRSCRTPRPGGCST